MVSRVISLLDHGRWQEKNRLQRGKERLEIWTLRRMWEQLRMRKESSARGSAESRCLRTGFTRNSGLDVVDSKIDLWETRETGMARYTPISVAIQL